MNPLEGQAMSEQEAQQEMRLAQQALQSLGNSDRLALWQSLEQRGSDEKNRMIATVTLVQALAGACLVAALADDSVALGVLSLAASAVGLVFVGFFAYHATRSYLAVDHLCQIHNELERIRDGLVRHNPVACSHQPGRLERLGGRIASSEGAWRLFPRVGRIFDVMVWLSSLMMIIAIILVVLALK